MRLRVSLSVLALAVSAHAHPSVSLVRDARGNIFYSDLAHVWKISAGSAKPVIAVKDVHTHELCLDAQGALLGEHVWYNGEKLDP